MTASTEEREFHHPFTPYAIQRQFMNGVYDCLENGKIGIFESPTGTGKSLSLICSSMTWLRDHKRQEFEGSAPVQGEEDEEPAWVLEHAQKTRKQAALRRRDEQEARLARIRAKEERAKARYDAGEPPHKRQKVATDARLEEDDDAAFLLDDYESEDDTSKRHGNANTSSDTGLSASTQALMDQLGLSAPKTKGSADEDPDDELKVFFCSRTHSQLSQFVNELRRVKLPSALELEESIQQEHAAPPIEEMKHTTLGSRKNLCINPKVNKLASTTAINERCLELRQTSTASEFKCQYLPNKENEPLVHEFRDHALAKIRDIEDFGKLGKRIGICPYYASRPAVKPSEIVTLPYPLLLQKSAREALEISLKDHVVIIDEAHNLMDAIANIHSSSITLDQLKQSRAQLGIYLQKFRNKLKGKNRVYVTQLVRLIDSLAGFLDQKLSTSVEADGQAQFAELMSGKGMDQINLFKLTRYVQESKIARKIERYIVHTEEQDTKAAKGDSETAPYHKAAPSTPVLTQISSFLEALTNPAAEGRFFYTRTANANGQLDVTLRYLLLDPTEHFREIVSEARAVILAGGTMSPMDDYINHLFHYLPLERIQTLSCGHVIPPSNLVTMPVVKGPNGVDFDFTFEKRSDKRVIDELGRAILQFSSSVPDGLVVFFPSYAYLDTVVKQWQTSGGGSPSLWDQLAKKKRIFMEPKSGSTAACQDPASDEAEGSSRKHDQAGSNVYKVLQAYSSHIHSPTRTDSGALLLAVIGGSLSEGINFSDRLGRGIAVVGLPFPNARSPEWKARLEFVEQRSCKSQRAGSDTLVKGTAGKASREFLENACMRAVNQSVGRAIRHKDDYAAIMLLDRRYERGNIKAKLPGWIKESLAPKASWRDVVGALDRFFEGKKQHDRLRSTVVLA